jgi:hypothetical protein
MGESRSATALLRVRLTLIPAKTRGRLRRPAHRSRWRTEPTKCRGIAASLLLGQ